MNIKLQDFNIYDILKGNLQGDGDSSATIALIQNLEKKVDAKFKLIDDIINKHDEDLFKYIPPPPLEESVASRYR